VLVNTGSTFVQASGYGGPEDPAAVITFNATIVSDSIAQCTLPSVLVGGPAVLALSANGVNWAAPFWWENTLEITLVEMVDVAVGRRPYYSETSGALLVYTDESLRGVPLKVSARLACVRVKPPSLDQSRRPGFLLLLVICVLSDSLFVWLQADRQWQWEHTPPPSGSLVASLPMDGLTSLPPSINADLTVAVVALDGN
jgi:hypothetical protein